MRQLTATGFCRYIALIRVVPMKANCRWPWITPAVRSTGRNVTSRATFPSLNSQQPEVAEQLWKDAAADFKNAMTSWHKWPEKRKKATPINALDKDYPILKKKPGRLFGLSFYMLENQWQCNGPTENKIVTIKAYNPRRITYSKLKV